MRTTTIPTQCQRHRTTTPNYSISEWLFSRFSPTMPKNHSQPLTHFPAVSCYSWNEQHLQYFYRCLLHNEKVTDTMLPLYPPRNCSRILFTVYQAVIVQNALFPKSITILFVILSSFLGFFRTFAAWFSKDWRWGKQSERWELPPCGIRPSRRKGNQQHEK